MQRISRPLIYAAFGAILLLAGCAQPPKERIVWPVPPDEPKLEFIGIYSSKADFEKTAGEAFVASMVGEDTSTRFTQPFDVVADGKGLVYVSDPLTSNLRVYDFNDKTVEFYSKEPVFSRPTGMTLDRAGNLYVVDTPDQSVKVFSPERRILTSFGGSDVFTRPAFVAVNDDLGRIYVSDVKEHKVKVFDLKGDFLFDFGRWGNADGAFHGPQGMAFGPDGQLYVADMYNARIQVFDPDGNFVSKFGERGDQPWQFEFPKDLAFDSAGNLYIVDNKRAALSIWTPDGTVLLTLGLGKSTAHSLGFSTPTGIWIDPSDRIYIADGVNKRFSVWQLLTEDYLKAHPLPPELKAADR